MHKKAVQELTLEGFQKYGSFANMINPQTVKIGGLFANAPPGAKSQFIHGY